MGCDVTAELVTVSSVKKLELCQCQDRILLMKGALGTEHLMPKNFIFYNPDHHKQIYTLLEKKKPVAINTVTRKKPERVGSLDPFPLIVDGDFDIPNAYCSDRVGETIADNSGHIGTFKLDGKRIAATYHAVLKYPNNH